MNSYYVLSDADFISLIHLNSVSEKSRESLRSSYPTPHLQPKSTNISCGQDTVEDTKKHKNDPYSPGDFKQCSM